MIQKTSKGVPCGICGKEATQESHNLPVCAECAVKHENKLKKEASFDA